MEFRITDTDQWLYIDIRVPLSVQIAVDWFIWISQIDLLSATAFNYSKTWRNRYRKNISFPSYRCIPDGKKIAAPLLHPLKKKRGKKKSDRNIRSKIKKKNRISFNWISHGERKNQKKKKKNINIFQSFFSHFISLISFDYPRNILDADKKVSCLRNSNENFERQIHPYSLWNFRYVIFFSFLHLREY